MFDDSFDKTKSEWTSKARGIDVIKAREIWNDPQAIEGPANVKDDEERWLKVGLINNRLWTVGFTLRKKGIRIFMVRPARKNERQVYHGY